MFDLIPPGQAFAGKLNESSGPALGVPEPKLVPERKHLNDVALAAVKFASISSLLRLGCPTIIRNP